MGWNCTCASGSIADAWRLDRLRAIEQRMVLMWMAQRRLDSTGALAEVCLGHDAHKTLCKLKAQLESAVDKAIKQLQSLQKQEAEKPSEYCRALLGSNEATEEANSSEEEELATDGAPKDTDEEGDEEDELEVERAHDVVNRST